MTTDIKSIYNEDIDPVKTYERKVSPNLAFYICGWEERIYERIATKDNSIK